MLYREIIAVRSLIHTKHINTLCGQNEEFVNVKLVIHIVTTGLKEWRDLTIYELTLNTHSLTLLNRNQTYLSVRSVAYLTGSKGSRLNQVKNCVALFGPSSCKTSGVSLSVCLSLSLSLTCHHVYIFVVLVCCSARYGTLLSSIGHWNLNIVLNLKASCVAQYEQYSAVCHLHWVWLYCEASLKIPQRVRNSLRRDSGATEADITITDWLTDWLTSKLHTGWGTVVSICTVRCNVHKVCTVPARRRHVRRMVGFTKQH